MTIYQAFYDFYTALFTPQIISDYQIIFNFLAFVSSLALPYLLISWAYSIIGRLRK